MKVLFVFNHPAPYKVRLYNELVKQMDIEVIFERKNASDRPKEFYFENEYNFPTHFIEKGAFGNENSSSGELKKLIKRNHKNYDFIVMNGYSTLAEMKAIRYMIRKRIPYILQVNGGIVHKESFIKRYIKTKYISHASYYLAPCPEVDEYLLTYKAKKENIFYYPYSPLSDNEVLSKPLTKEEKEAIRKECGLPSSPLFVSASQLIDRKNIVQLIDVFSKVKGNLIIYGDGKEKEKYLEMIKTKNLDNIKIEPFEKKDNLLNKLKVFDAFITLSKEDIYGHTTVEAMACGLPVISSNKVISSLHLIKEGVNGAIVDLENEEQIITAINNYEKYSPVSAIEEAKENTIGKTVQSFIKFFKEISQCK